MVILQNKYNSLEVFSENLDTINTSLNRFQIDNTFLMLDKKEEQVEGFLYATRPNESNFDYISNLDILKKFNCFFTREMSSVIKNMHSEGFNLKAAKEINFFKRKEGLPLAAKDQISQDFLKMISPLSPQEERCLDLFRSGYSAQATASIMNLSRRTVEHYFESIKFKLGCYSKWDLLK